MDIMKKLPLWLTIPHQCSYLADQRAQFAVVDPAFAMTSTIYSHLLEQGFRRNGNEVYSPYCVQCSQCVPVRIPVAEFSLRRQQQRCLRKNQQTVVKLKPPVFDPLHFKLYQCYQQHRHAEGSMQHHRADEYLQFFSSDWCKTLLVEFWQQQTLMAVAVVDQFEHSLSAVYTFFDPQFAQYSLGVYAVLWQIDYARQFNIDYVYLGFWIANCAKMAYKINYQPLQGFINQQWNYVIP
jgi:arginyl-tRNA--protein-N-Asp/Glu arginylyltransferase